MGKTIAAIAIVVIIIACLLLAAFSPNRLTPNHLLYEGKPMNERKPDYIFFGADDIPKRYWLTKNALITKTFCWAASNQEDADDGRFTCLELNKCQPYTDGLWTACEDYMRRREQANAALLAEFYSLKKGQFGMLFWGMPLATSLQIPDGELQAYNAGSLAIRVINLGEA